jgi:hypothetical protein
VKTLRSTIATLFQRQISDEAVYGLINEMANKGYLRVSAPTSLMGKFVAKVSAVCRLI